MSEKALFDPGFAPMVYDFSEGVETIKNILRDIKIPNQRAFRFRLIQPQIIELVKNSVAFYLGCLMWAKYLKNAYAEKEKEIENNPFYAVDLDKEGITVDVFCSEVNAFLTFCENYPKDSKFYSGKELFIDEKFCEIAKIYKDFLLLNDSFINTKYTSDLILPDNIEKILKHDDNFNKKLIDKVISDKNIFELLTVI